MKVCESWGRVTSLAEDIVPLRWTTEELRLHYVDKPVLPFGMGRSYGDSCLNDRGVLLDTRGLNRFISFDGEKGLIRCEAGVTLAEILKVVVPKGWFLPVTPGTKFVTVGGAIANDVHGKNHHRVGTFGRYVTVFALLRSDGDRLVCSPTQNPDWYRMTIGGLGLTGLILWAEIQLKKIDNAFIEIETRKFRSLDEFFDLSNAASNTHEYTVAWVDSTATGNALGRGVFMQGNDAQSFHGVSVYRLHREPLNLPMNGPNQLLNKFSLKAFNAVYYHRTRAAKQIVHYDPFFYPLDALGQWNRLYGKRGFFQYQCVVPDDGRHDVIRSILKLIADSSSGSFLAVLKQFGTLPSPGLLSFPKSGTTLAVDFPNNGRRTLELMERLDEAVRCNGGAVYPAKDARMSPRSFEAYFPQWKQFAQFIDPQFSSSFWRRVTEGLA